MPRPVTTLGQQWLGKLVHPMHKDSYLGRLNLETNPLNYVLSKLRPQTKASPQVVGQYEVPAGVVSDAPYRVATYYKAGTASDDLLTTLGKARGQGERGLRQQDLVQQSSSPSGWWRRPRPTSPSSTWWCSPKPIS